MKLLALLGGLTAVCALTLPADTFGTDDYSEFLEESEKSNEDLFLESTTVVPEQMECPSVNQRQVNAGIKPKYELNPNLFITPVFIWGPSSQLQGLRGSSMWRRCKEAQRGVQTTDRRYDQE